MIYVKIEIWPGGNRARARCLQEALIYNKGGTRSMGEYTYLFSKVGGFKAETRDMQSASVKNILRSGEVKGFPRLRLYAHDLLLRALALAFGARNAGAFGVEDVRTVAAEEGLSPPAEPGRSAHDPDVEPQQPKVNGVLYAHED